MPGASVLRCSVPGGMGVWLSAAAGGLCQAAGPRTLPWPTPLCSAPGPNAAPSRDCSQGFSTVPPQGAALHTTV